MDSAFSSSEWSVSYNEVCSIVSPIDTSPCFSHILDDILKSSGSILSIDLNPNSSLVIFLIDGFGWNSFSRDYENDALYWSCVLIVAFHMNWICSPQKFILLSSHIFQRKFGVARINLLHCKQSIWAITLPVTCLTEFFRCEVEIKTSDDLH